MQTEEINKRIDRLTAHSAERMQLEGALQRLASLTPAGRLPAFNFLRELEGAATRPSGVDKTLVERTVALDALQAVARHRGEAISEKLWSARV